jgi:hypothetical protein
VEAKEKPPHYDVKAATKYLMQVTRYTGANIYTAMKRMACNKSKWQAAKQSKD